MYIISGCSIKHEYKCEDSIQSDGSIQFNNGLIRNRSFLKATRFGKRLIILIMRLFLCHKIESISEKNVQENDLLDIKVQSRYINMMYLNFLDSQMSPKTDRHRPRYKKMETLDERDSVSYNVIETYSTKVQLIHDIHNSE